MAGLMIAGSKVIGMGTHMQRPSLHKEARLIGVIADSHMDIL